MSGLPIIDLLIGMIFIYFLLSIICSSAVELWLSVNATRSKLLRQWLVKVFNEEPFDFAGKQITGKKLGEAIIEHCTTVALADSKTTNDYINSENFVSALLDHVTRPITPVTIFTPPPSNIGGYITAIQNTTAIGPELKKTFLAFAYDAQNA